MTAQQIGFEVAKIGASLLGGGLCGAIFTALVTAYRNRIQQIGKRIEMLPVLFPKPDDSALRVRVTIEENGKQHEFANLFAFNLQIVNHSRQDFATFSFGVTAFNNDRIVFVESSGIDRFHLAKPTATPSPTTPVAEVDFQCSPLNRGDIYNFRIFVVAAGSQPHDLAVGTSMHGVRLVAVPTWREFAAAAAITAATATIEVGVPGAWFRISR